MTTEGAKLAEAKRRLDGARALLRDAEKLLASRKREADDAWSVYRTAAIEAEAVTKVEAKVRSYSHLLEGSLTVERKARFCDISGEEMAPNTGAKLILTHGENRYEADIADSQMETVLDLLNNPEAKKKRGRPAEGDKPAEAEAEKKEPAAAAK